MTRPIENRDLRCAFVCTWFIRTRLVRADAIRAAAALMTSSETLGPAAIPGLALSGMAEGVVRALRRVDWKSHSKQPLIRSQPGSVAGLLKFSQVD